MCTRSLLLRMVVRHMAVVVVRHMAVVVRRMAVAVLVSREEEEDSHN